MNVNLPDFVRESNKIEGIIREPLKIEILATEVFLALDKVTVEELDTLVIMYQPGAKLRDQHGMDVIVGNHHPPKGGMYIRQSLRNMLLLFKRGENPSVPYLAHQYYEDLHPFTDGNGRTGRALWLWYMNGNAPLGFLHTWYYQSLHEAQTD